MPVATMQSARSQARAPGSFSPLPSVNDMPRQRPRLESSSSDDSVPQLNVARPRGPAARQGLAQPSQQQQQQQQQQPSHAAGSPVMLMSPTPIYAAFTSHANSSTSSLQNFSRPTPSTAAAAARSVAAAHSPIDSPLSRNGSSSPLAMPVMPGASSARGNTSPSTTTFLGGRGHSRKHSQNAGLFEPTLPSTSTSNLSQIGMAQVSSPTTSAARELSASQIAAQAAVMHHQSQQQQNQQQHARQRSQTVPVPGGDYDIPPSLANKRGSGGPLSPPLLSLTEASTPRESGFGNQSYHNGLLGNPTAAATTAANVVFPRSGHSSPALLPQAPPLPPPLPPPPLSAMSSPPAVPEKPPKAEKSKVKLFSRPGKISVKGEAKDKPLPSPSKIGQAFSSLQRANFSTTSLDSTATSFYSMANSSSATIRPVDSGFEKEGKDKEKKHHFLSRQKHKLRDKDDFHLPLSSAASNSKPSDPNAPSSLYSFNLPPSPGPSSTSFKAMSALDLRHGSRGLKKKDEKGADVREAESTLHLPSEWPGPSSLNSAAGNSLYLNETLDSGKFGLNNMTLDDAWPFLKAKLLVIFEGEDLRLPIEDFNRIVSMHIQYCIQRRSPNIIVEDLRDLLATGFASLDYTLRKTPEDRLIPALVEMWMFAFTNLLPYMQAVFLPLDLEFCGNGPLMTKDQARDFWGGVVASSTAGDSAITPGGGGARGPGQGSISVSPASSVLDVRRMVLLAYRDAVILPRYDILKNMFSRFSLEFLPRSLASAALASPPLTAPGGQFGQLHPHSPLEQPHLSNILPGSPSGDGSAASFTLSSLGGFPAPPRPGTAMSLDPSVSSYNSTGTTLLGDGGSGSGSVSASGLRSRAISNVSFASSGDHGANARPFTPGGLNALASNNGGGTVLGGSSFSGPGGGTTTTSSNGSAAGGGGVGGGGSAGSAREQNAEDSKQVTEMVGRMLQCMNVLVSVGVGAAGGDEDKSKLVEELCKLLKANWLGARGRTGRRHGVVGGRLRRGISGADSNNTNNNSATTANNNAVGPFPPAAREEVAAA